MPELSEEQIDFIEADIRRRGVFIRGLQDDLLDHICCLLENRMGRSEDFATAYAQVLRDFGEKGLQGIQDETTYLLTHKYREKMKKLMFGSGLLAVFCLTAGGVFKVQHWPGAGILLLCGIALLTFFFVPIWFVMRFREATETQQKVVNIVGLISTVLLLVPALFRIMHWPYGNVLLVSGFVFFFLIFLPLYFITGYRNPVTRYTTISSSVLLGSCAGLLLLHVFQQPSRNYQDAQALAEAYDRRLLENEVKDRDALYAQLTQTDSTAKDAHDKIKTAHAVFASLHFEIDALSARIAGSGGARASEEDLMKVREIEQTVAEINRTMKSFKGFYCSELEMANMESGTADAARRKLHSLKEQALSQETALYQFIAGHRYALTVNSTK